MREVQAVQASLHSYPKEVSRITYHVSRARVLSFIAPRPTLTYGCHLSQQVRRIPIVSVTSSCSYFFLKMTGRLRSRPTSYSDTRMAQVYGKAQ